MDERSWNSFRATPATGWMSYNSTAVRLSERFFTSASARLVLGSVIVVTASIVVFYMMSILLGLPLGWILGLLVSSMIATVWMAIRILKDPYAPDKTFDEYFYQDRPDMRRNSKE